MSVINNFDKQLLNVLKTPDMYFVCFPNNTGIFITDILYNEEEAINQLTGSGFVLPYKQLKELHKTGSNIE